MNTFIDECTELLNRPQPLTGYVGQLAMRLKESNNRLAAAEKALKEIDRRTNLLIHQNIGRWDMTVEHDARSQGVSEGNRRIAIEALQVIRAGLCGRLR